MSEWVSQNIHNKVIFLNSPAHFNDPTENNFSLQTLEECERGESLKKEIIKSIYKSFNDKVFSNNLELSSSYAVSKKIDLDEALDKYADDLYEKLEGKDVESFCHEVVRNAQMEFRIASLTKKKHNPLMWGHYADGMRGVCVEYDIDEKDLNEVLYKECYKVNVMEIMAGGGDEEVKKTFLRKSPNWDYEKEYRIIRIGEDFYNLNEGQVKKIYFGYKCDPGKANFIKDMAISSFGEDVQFYVTRNQFSSYLMKDFPVHKDGLMDKIVEVRESANDPKTFFEDAIHDNIFSSEMKNKNIDKPLK